MVAGKHFTVTKWLFSIELGFTCYHDNLLDLAQSGFVFCYILTGIVFVNHNICGK